MGIESPPVRSLLAVGCLVLAAGCFNEAARTNPLDPRGADFEAVGVLSGRVTNRSNVPLDGVRVQLEPDTSASPALYTARTGPAGQFRLANLPPGTYIMTVEVTRYVPLTDTVHIEVQQTVEKTPVLNGAPVMNEATFTSAHIRRAFPAPFEFYRLDLVARVEDPDGSVDLDRVWFEIPDLGLVDTLEANETPGVFDREIFEEDLPDGQLTDVLGRSLVLKIRDRTGYVAESTPRPLTRLIETVPLTIAPQAGEIVSGDPTPALAWACSDLSFAHTYRIQMVRSDFAVQTPLFTRNGLVPADVCDDEGTGVFEVDMALQPGTYFWTVAVVDPFGNMSRSREAGFLIE